MQRMIKSIPSQGCGVDITAVDGCPLDTLLLAKYRIRLLLFHALAGNQGKTCFFLKFLLTLSLSWYCSSLHIKNNQTGTCTFLYREKSHLPSYLLLNLIEGMEFSPGAFLLFHFIFLDFGNKRENQEF